jgi:high frequency lysogenization protein
MARTLRDAALALAGVFQATYLVREVAHHGTVPSNLLEISIHSLFELDPPDTESVYGGRGQLHIGLRLLQDQLGGDTKKADIEITKYVVALMHLERKLVRNQELMGRLKAGLTRIRAQAEHFSYTHENVLAALADLYVNTVSTLTPRIVVSGQQGHLTHPANANKVRALLLAAIRSVVLWRQSGGNRFQLLFKRKQLAAEAEALKT